MTDHIDNRIEFDAQTAAAGAVMEWIDKPLPPEEPHRALIGCTPAMIAQTAVDAYSRSREAACAIATVEQLDALPRLCVVLDARSAAWQKDDRYTSIEPWWSVGSEIEQPSNVIPLPAVLVWHPAWGGQS